MEVKLKWITPDAEIEILEIARTSFPITKSPRQLLKYLIYNKHFAPLEMASMCIDIKTSKAISHQIYHNDIQVFHEFSQSLTFEPVNITNNNLLKTSKDNVPYHVSDLIKDHVNRSRIVYDTLIKEGVAQEQASMLLPECTQIHMYMSGTLRAWLSMLNVKLNDNQKEVVDISLEIVKIMKQELPLISHSTNYFNNNKGLFIDLS